MKNDIVCFIAIGVLAGCSADPEALRSPAKTYESSHAAPKFSSLATGGVSLPKVDKTYELPNISVNQREKVDIRPPSTPLALVKNSLTKFDGERALIVYTEKESSIYNLKQVARLFKEEGINGTINGATFTTDWALIERADEKPNTEIKYQVEQVAAKGASALTISVLQMRRDGILFTPSIAEKQRYTSTQLNHIVSTLNSTYQKQLKDLSGGDVITQ